MTPKEKCKELIIKFSPLVTTWDCYNDAPESDEEILADAKKCALIAVDEILNAVTTIADKKYDFWQEVKKEIEKL